MKHTVLLVQEGYKWHFHDFCFFADLGITAYNIHNGDRYLSLVAVETCPKKEKGYKWHVLWMQEGYNYNLQGYIVKAHLHLYILAFYYLVDASVPDKSHHPSN